MCVCVGACAIFITEILSVLSSWFQRFTDWRCQIIWDHLLYSKAVSIHTCDTSLIQRWLCWALPCSRIVSTTISHMDMSAVSYVPQWCMFPVLCRLFVPILIKMTTMKRTVKHQTVSVTTPSSREVVPPTPTLGIPSLHWHGSGATASRISYFLVFFPVGWHIA